MHILADLCETLLQNINSLLRSYLSRGCFCNYSTRFSVPKCKNLLSQRGVTLQNILHFGNENRVEQLQQAQKLVNVDALEILCNTL